MKVLVAIALRERQEVVELELPEGSRVEDALAASRFAELAPKLALAQARVGIWGKPCEASAVLRDGDRVEVYRELKADPKAQRRSRAGIKPASPRSRNAP